MRIKATISLAAVARICDQGAAGPCRARNSALRAASAPWVFLLDEDAYPAAGCLDRLLEVAAADPAAAIISPRVLRASDPRRIHYDGGHAHFLAELCLDNAHRLVEGASPPSSRPTAVATTALLIHRERALDAGLFDEDLVFFREDLDFSLRLRAAGWGIRHCSAAIVHHGRSDGVRGVLHRRRTFYQTRNRWRIILKIFEARTILLSLPWQAGYELLNLALALRCGTIGQYGSAFIDLFRRLPEILASRRKFQAHRRLPDRLLLGAPALSWTPEVSSAPLADPLRFFLDAACRAGWHRIADK
ncbi:MAG: glycosyltransferase family 2 protein [Elusimicrobia bacterium]|nr:glycosyltransferase family 2 protein [Elusimicrobiota bacterium]